MAASEMVSVKIAFHPDDGSEQTTHTREFVIPGRSHSEVMRLFREFCDQMQEEYVVDVTAQLGIEFEDEQPALAEGGDKEKNGGRR